MRKIHAHFVWKARRGGTRGPGTHPPKKGHRGAPCTPDSIPGLDRTTPSIRLESLSPSNGIEDSGKRTVFVLVIARVHLFNLTDRGALEQWDDMRPSMPPVATRATHRSRECETTIERVLWGTTSRREEPGAQGHEIERKCGDLRHQRGARRVLGRAY